MKTPLIKCSCCGGKGTILLGDDHKRTLEKLTELKEATTDQLQERGVSASAICVRLQRMKAWGLVKIVRKESKNFVWAPA